MKLTEENYEDLFKELYVDMGKDSMVNEDFSNFMEFANRDLIPESKFTVVQLAIRLIRIQRKVRDWFNDKY